MRWYDIAMLVVISMILGRDLTVRNRDYFIIMLDLLIIFMIVGAP